MFTRARNFLCTILASPTVRSPVKRTGPSAVSIPMGSKRLLCTLPDDKTLKVVHKPEDQEFRIELQNGCAYLAYEKEGDLIKIMHTKVPEELGGRGIGKLLAKAALQHIEKNEYRAEAYCDYFRYYVETYERKYLKYFENQTTK